MDAFLYILGRALIWLLQLLPLSVMARLGRIGGALAYALDRRHRRVALENLTACFQAEMSPQAIRALARENFRRIGENFTCAAKTAVLDAATVRRRTEFQGGEHLDPNDAAGHQSRVIAIGHFGNFELYARASLFVPGYQFATTYRALRQPGLNRVLQELRARSGCLYFERRSEAQQLRTLLNQRRVMLGLLADQHAGDHGLPVPFFGRAAATSAAPALFALRYHCPLHTAFCFRLAPGRWRFELGPEIPTRQDGRSRALEDIMADVNRALEAAIRRDPANWFWVHRRWKPGLHRRARRAPVPAGGPPDDPPYCKKRQTTR